MNVKRDGMQCVGYEMHIVLKQIMMKGVKPSSSQMNKGNNGNNNKNCIEIEMKYTRFALHKVQPTNELQLFFLCLFRSLRFYSQMIYPKKKKKYYNNRKWSPFTFDKMALYHNCNANGTFH